MSFCFVVTSIDPDVAKDPRIAYSNLSSTSSTIVASHDNANTGYLYDDMTTLKWLPANAAPNITYTGSFTDVDYVAVSGCNWATAGATLTVKDSGGATLAAVSGLEDNQPALLVFTKANQTVINCVFSCTNTLLEVGDIAFGESMLFPRNVSVGYQPGRWTSSDDISFSQTENNQLGASTVRAKGSIESFKIALVETSFIETDYKAFIKNAKGKPIYFIWNKDNADHAFFGHWSATPPTFESSFLSSINLTLRGVG